MNCGERRYKIYKPTLNLLLHYITSLEPISILLFNMFKSSHNHYIQHVQITSICSSRLLLITMTGYKRSYSLRSVFSFLSLNADPHVHLISYSFHFHLTLLRALFSQAKSQDHNLLTSYITCRFFACRFSLKIEGNKDERKHPHFSQNYALN